MAKSRVVAPSRLAKPGPANRAAEATADTVAVAVLAGVARSFSDANAKREGF
jgi:hypothetical protein